MLHDLLDIAAVSLIIFWSYQALRAMGFAPLGAMLTITGFFTIAASLFH